MTKVFETMKKYGTGNYKRHQGEYGIEIEAETKAAYVVPEFTFWGTHADPSLRDFGIEYVLHQPVKFEKELRAALEEFEVKTKGISFKKDSFTTSVHVHINMLNEDWLTVANFLTVYSLVENLLARYAGENRKSNLFALPIVDAEETYRNILDMLRSVENKTFNKLRFNPDNVKYAALNLAALDRFGSFENRLFRGSTSADEIYTWVALLHKILQYARNPKLNPILFVEQYKQRETQIVESIFEELAGKVMTDRTSMLLKKNIAYPYFISKVSTWENFGKLPKPKSNEDLDKLAMDIFGLKFEQLPALDQLRVINEVKGGGKKKKGPFEDAVNQAAVLNQVAGGEEIDFARLRLNRNNRDEGIPIAERAPVVERWRDVVRHVNEVVPAAEIRWGDVGGGIAPMPPHPAWNLDNLNQAEPQPEFNPPPDWDENGPDDGVNIEDFEEFINAEEPPEEENF